MSDERIVIASTPGRSVFAFTVDGVLERLEIVSAFDDDTAWVPGDVVLGRIVKVLKNGQGAMVDLGGTIAGFLPLKSAKTVAAPGGGTVRDLHEGAAVMAQVARAGVDGKGPRLRADIRLPDPALRPGLDAQAREADPPARLWRDGPPLTRILRAWRGARDVPVLVDTPALRREVDLLLGDSGPVTAIQERDGALAATGLEDQIDLLFARTVPLGDGASITIDPTEALTAIDVNAGPDGVPGSRRLTVNRAAAGTIARHLRLRDIGGLIVIDFLDLDRADDRERLRDDLRAAVQADTMAVEIGPVSGFGTIEVTRQRSGMGLLDRWQSACGRCGGTGRVPSMESRALDMLAAITRHDVRGPLTVMLGAALHDWIMDRLAVVKAEFTRHGLALVTFARDDALAPADWALVYEPS